jgi:stage V sporulation protein G
MEITDVRVRLIEHDAEPLRAFCSITLDDDFVVRDLKVVEGTGGLFVAMPSRKMTTSCGRCGHKNPARSKFCNECGGKLRRESGGRDGDGRGKVHREIAHPTNSEFRELIQNLVIEAYQAELQRSADDDYEPGELEEEFDAPEERQQERTSSRGPRRDRARAQAPPARVEETEEDSDLEFGRMDFDDGDEGESSDEDTSTRDSSEDEDIHDFNSLIADLKGLSDRRGPGGRRRTSSRSSSEAESGEGAPRRRGGKSSGGDGGRSRRGERASAGEASAEDGGSGRRRRRRTGRREEEQAAEAAEATSGGTQAEDVAEEQESEAFGSGLSASQSEESSPRDGRTNGGRRTRGGSSSRGGSRGRRGREASREEASERDSEVSAEPISRAEPPAAEPITEDPWAAEEEDDLPFGAGIVEDEAAEVDAPAVAEIPVEEAAEDEVPRKKRGRGRSRKTEAPPVEPELVAPSDEAEEAEDAEEAVEVSASEESDEEPVDEVDLDTELDEPFLSEQPSEDTAPFGAGLT